MFSSSNQQKNPYYASNQATQQQTSFANYQPGPVYGSTGQATQQVYHAQQGMFGGYHTHQVPQHHHHYSEDQGCCRII